LALTQTTVSYSPRAEYNLLGCVLNYSEFTYLSYIGSVGIFYTLEKLSNHGSIHVVKKWPFFRCGISDASFLKSDLLSLAVNIDGVTRLR